MHCRGSVPNAVFAAPKPKPKPVPKPVEAEESKESAHPRDENLTKTHRKTMKNSQNLDTNMEFWIGRFIFSYTFCVYFLHIFEEIHTFEVREQLEVRQ